MVAPMASIFAWSVARGRHVCLLRLEDRTIVDVGEVHHVPHAVAGLVLQRAAQDVQRHERPEVADVTAGIHGEPAGIHAHLVALTRRKRFLSTCQGVVKTHADV